MTWNLINSCNTRHNSLLVLLNIFICQWIMDFFHFVFWTNSSSFNALHEISSLQFLKNQVQSNNSSCFKCDHFMPHDLAVLKLHLHIWVISRSSQIWVISRSLQIWVISRSSQIWIISRSSITMQYVLLPCFLKRSKFQKLKNNCQNFLLHIWFALWSQFYATRLKFDIKWF